MAVRRALLLVSTIAWIPGLALPAVAQTLTPHRAIYDLDLIDTSDRSSITGVSGRMVYEFNGSACEGYTVSFRSVTRFQTDDEEQLIDQQVTTFEDPADDLFTFVTKSFVDKRLDKEVKGTARQSDTGTHVELEKPDEGTVDLQKAKFPAEHMIDILSRALKGERFFETAIYDGTEDGDAVLTTSVVVGTQRSAEGSEAELKAMGVLAEQKFWPVSIAYFDDPNPEGEGLPIYRIDLKLYDSGIARDFATDYGDFQISGKLVDLDLFDQPACQ